MTGGDVSVSSKGILEVHGDIHLQLFIQRGDGDFKTYPEGWELAADMNLKNHYLALNVNITNG